MASAITAAKAIARVRFSLPIVTSLFISIVLFLSKVPSTKTLSSGEWLQREGTNQCRATRRASRLSNLIATNKWVWGYVEQTSHPVVRDLYDHKCIW